MPRAAPVMRADLAEGMSAGLVEFQAGGLGERQIARDLASYQLVELGRRQREGFDALDRELVLDGRSAEDLRDLVVQAFDDRLRCLRRRKKPVPERVVRIREAG